jgi:parallel beta-helix repeat protein
VTITASGELEYAFEETDPEHVEDRGALSPGSVFTRCLVEGLQSGGADLDRDGSVSIDELYDYVYARVRERSPQQTPSKAGTGHGDIIIARSPRTATLPAELRDALENPVAAIRETALRELADMRRTAAPGVAAAIEEALHRAMHDDSRRVSECARQLLGREAPPPPATITASEPPPMPSEPQPRSEPGTLRVDQRGRGDHFTLAEALAAATPGTQILVSAGVYVETASLSVPGVEIRGEGQREDIVVRAPEGEPAVIVTATSTHVSGLTLQTSTKRGGAGPGITVHPNAHVSLADSSIARANGAGVSFMPSSSGTLERNGISECAGPGVSIRREAEATLRGNRIHDNERRRYHGPRPRRRRLRGQRHRRERTPGDRCGSG